MPRSMPAAALVLALAQGVAGAKRASKAAAAAAAAAQADDDTTWRIAVIVTLFVLVLTLLALNHVTRPFKFWGFSRAAAPFNGGDPKPPKPEPPTPFDEARTRRMKRMFQKYATRDDDGMIAASNLGELFADCGHAVPSAEELQGLLNRYPSHNDRDEAVGARAFVRWLSPSSSPLARKAPASCDVIVTWLGIGLGLGLGMGFGLGRGLG